jgi:pimeloyl-ACP methyl ester carboxylesterase
MAWCYDARAMNASHRKLFAALFSTLLALAAMPARADKIGIVLMHGKLGLPLGTSAGRGPAIGAELIAALKGAGYLVTAPEMCWSRRRGFDKPFADCLAEIEPQIAALRQDGATAIVIGGVSLGGNAALFFAATHGNEVAGVIGLSPADDPVRKARRPEVAAALDRARALVAAGKGDMKDVFADVNTGAQGSYAMALNTTANIYLSFYDPGGPAAMASTVAKLTVPLLWVAGSEDPTQRDAKSLYFDHAPANPKSAYVPVTANHLTAADAAKDAVLKWLAALR